MTVAAPGIAAPVIAGLVIAGLGTRPGCDAAEIAALLDRAARLAGCVPTLLAAPWFRAGEPGLRQPLALALIPQSALLAVQAACPTRSARALRETGLASVAEACALAAAGEGGVLLLPRIASANATCAIARGLPP